MTDSNSWHNATLMRKRQVWTVSAYIYERMGETWITDSQYDQLSLELEASKNEETGHAELDKWWREEFNPNTGMCIYSHPHQERLATLCRELLNSKEGIK